MNDGKNESKKQDAQPLVDVIGDTTLMHSGGEPRNRILIGTPTLGIIRMEWSATRRGQVIPCNWEAGSLEIGIPSAVPMKYLVADAQNLIVQHGIQQGHEWLLLWEDDVMPPIDLFMKLNEYIRTCEVPVVSGLYYTKSEPSEPLVYKEFGKSFFGDWKLGDKVWVKGVPTGMLLVHFSVLKLMYEESPVYGLFNGVQARKVFKSPRNVWIDPEKNYYQSAVGTSDLAWCKRILDNNILARAGWKQVGKKEYPFLIDTDILCKHIDLQTGTQYPQGTPGKKEPECSKKT